MKKEKKKHCLSAGNVLYLAKQITYKLTYLVEDRVERESEEVGSLRINGIVGKWLIILHGG